MEKEEKKPKSKARKIIEWVGTIIAGIFIVFAATCNFAKLLTRNEYGQGTSFGFSSYLVLTDSMEPVYMTDTAIITYKEKPAKILEEWNKIKDLNLDKTDERCINLTFVDAYTEPTIPANPMYNNQTTNESSPEYGMVMTHQLFEIQVHDDIEEGKGKYVFLVHGINTEGHMAGANQFQAFTEKELMGVVKLNSKFIGGITSFLSSVWGLLICLLIPCLYMVITSILDIIKAYNMPEDEEQLATEGANKAALSDEDYEKLKQEMINEMLGKGDKK